MYLRLAASWEAEAKRLVAATMVSTMGERGDALCRANNLNRCAYELRAMVAGELTL